MNECFLQALAGKQAPQQRGGFGAALAAVNVRVGAVGDDRIGARHHPVGDIRVQIDRRHHRPVRADCVARERVERSVRIGVRG